jgi:oxidase EvaA
MNAVASLNEAFRRSALCVDGRGLSNDSFHAWMDDCRSRHRFSIDLIPFAAMDKWKFDPATGDLGHESGRFFRIEGVRVETNFGSIPQWSQPIINQPEVGILGVLAKEIDGVLHFLMQAKMEPGNINTVQLSPTLQATRSNYSQVHQGRQPRYLQFFRNRERCRVLVDVLQSEQGSRFLKKRNRNIIIEVPSDADVPACDDFVWLTLGQIFRLLDFDNVVNMDARTVLSCLPHLPGSYGPAGGRILKALKRSAGAPAASSGPSRHTIDEILMWFTDQKMRYDLRVERIPLRDVAGWVRTATDIHHEDGKFFRVIAVCVAAGNREVPAWTQPLVQPREPGILALILKPFHGVVHLLVQAKVEPGNFDIVEMAPTVQCLTGSYRDAPPRDRPPFLDAVLNARPDQVVLDTLQSEEGGRFYQEANRNMAILVGDEFSAEVPPNFMWMTFGQLKEFVRFNNYVNVQCRCLTACLGSV